MSLIEQLNHLRIPLEDIQAATQNFTTLIGSGGYGPVYKGQLSLSRKLTIVAVKQLRTDNLSGQGRKEFLTEIQMLSRYKHQNIVSLVGFCEDRIKKFLVYEYAEKGSLNNYLKPTKTRCLLTWRRRINICIDVARGLDHLHNHVAKNQRVIHRDIKSSNILLDHNWKAMIADFGLSKIGRANESVTYIITNASGTYGYCDPEYINSGILTKESDVYSFGVVLFEVLFGRLCFNRFNGEEHIAQLAIRYYKEGKLNLVIDSELKNYMNSDSMKEFSKIAFECLGDIRSNRPPMDFVLQKLEKSLKLLEIEEAPELLELEEELQLPKLVKTLQLQHFKEACGKYELEEMLAFPEVVETLELEIGESRIDHDVIKAIYDMSDTFLACITRDKIYSHLSAGILVDEDKVWFSIDEDGRTHEIISAIKFVPLDGEGCRTRSHPDSRFHMVVEVLLPVYYMQVKIRTRFLSSHVTYAAFLLCKPDSWPRMEDHHEYSLSYKLNDIRKSYVSYPSKMEDNGWWMFELFQTINFKRSIDFVVKLQIMDKSFGSQFHLLIEGIKFLPIQKFDQDNDEYENIEVNNCSTSNIEWGDRLPSDYKQFIHYSNKKLKNHQGDVIFPTKEEAFSILLKGVLIKVNNKVNLWFWITKLDGKKCFILPPTLLSYDKQTPRKIKWIQSKKSRIKNVLHLSTSKVVGMHFKVPNGLFSTNTAYGCYLVYKMPQGVDCKTLVEVKFDHDSVLRGNLAYLSAPQIPLIGVDGACRSTRSISNLKTIQLPRNRKDGWSEVTVKNIQEDEVSGFAWSRGERTSKSWFLPCISYKESHNRADNDAENNFTLNSHYFSTITILMYSIDMVTSIPELIVEGIEFRPL